MKQLVPTLKSRKISYQVLRIHQFKVFFINIIGQKNIINIFKNLGEYRVKPSSSKVCVLKSRNKFFACNLK